MREPPRGRRFQDDRFEVDDVVGRPVEQIVGFVAGQAPDDDLLVLFLKVPGMWWQKMFLDAWLGVWEEWNDDDTFDDFRGDDALFEIDYAARYGLVGAIIRGARCSPEGITIELDRGTLLLSFVDLDDADSASRVTFAPRA